MFPKHKARPDLAGFQKSLSYSSPINKILGSLKAYVDDKMNIAQMVKFVCEIFLEREKRL